MVNEFINYQRSIKGLSPLTLRAYEKDIRQFVSWAQPKGLRWSTITKQDIDNWVRSIEEKAPATRRRKITAVRAIFTWAHHEGLLAENPARYLQSPKLAETLPMGAEPEKIANYLDTVPTTREAIICHALTALIADTGIRLQEAIDLRCQDVNIEQQTMTIHGKGNKQRTVYFTQLTVEHCARTANMRLGYLIPLTDQWALRKIMYTELGTHPHALRHMFATKLLNNGASLTTIGKLLGHKHSSTTERYAKVADRTARAEYNMYH